MFLFKHSMSLLKTYSIILISGVRDNNWTPIYLTKWSPQDKFYLSSSCVCLMYACSYQVTQWLCASVFCPLWPTITCNIRNYIKNDTAFSSWKGNIMLRKGSGLGLLLSPTSCVILGKLLTSLSHFFPFQSKIRAAFFTVRLLTVFISFLTNAHF